MTFFETIRNLREGERDLEDDAMGSKAAWLGRRAYSFSAMGDHGNGALWHGAAAARHEAAAKRTSDKSVQQYHGLMVAHHNTMKSYHEAQ